MENALLPDEEAAFRTAELERFMLEPEPVAEPLHPLAEERIILQSRLALATERVVALEQRYAKIVAELVELHAGPTIPVAKIERLKNHKARVAKTLHTARNNYLLAIAETSETNWSIREAGLAKDALIRILQKPELHQVETLPATEFIEAA